MLNLYRHSGFRLRSLLLAILCCFCIPQSYAQQAQSVDAYAVTAAGANYRVYSRQAANTNANGDVIYRTNSYTELASGLNHLVDGQWIDSSDIINITATGGAATNSQHQVYFAPNINTAGSISVVTPSGMELSGTVLGLSLYDSVQDKTVVIAQVQNSTGQVLPTLNQVLYTNALADSQSDFSADVLYTHHVNHFEQDVVLHKRTPDPVDLGMNPDTTVIQVWTEFVRGNDPNVTTNTASTFVRHNGQLIKEAVADQILDFNGMRMGSGVASAIGGATNTPDGDSTVLIPVTKRWVRKGTQRFLVEEVPFDAVAAQLSVLPSPILRVSTNAQQSFFKSPTGVKRIGSLAMAKNYEPSRAGFVLDYNLVNTSVTNFTFQSDTTYYIGGTVNLYGNTTVEGGTVVKCGTTGLDVMNGEVNWLTGPYRPAIFTVTNDDSVGVTISGSSGIPTLGNSTCFYSSQGGIVHDARFSYLFNGFSGSAANVEVRDCQFFECSHPITANTGVTNLALRNVLITMANSINYAGNVGSHPPAALTIYSPNVAISGEQVTANLGSQDFIEYEAGNSSGSAKLTNSIILTPYLNPYYYYGSLVGITVATNAVYYTNSNPGTLFQTVGGASYYLATNSPAKSAGVIGISPKTLTDISHKTTYPPVVYALQTISSNLTLHPQAQRDTNVYPDLGYHYDPLDYAFGHTQLGSNITLTITPGTAVAYFRTNGTAFGLKLLNNSAFLSQGDPINLSRQVEFAAVQELSTTNWAQLGLGGEFIFTDDLNTVPTIFNCFFTDFSIICLDTYPFYCEGTTNSGPINLQNCQIHGGYMEVDDDTCNFTNCLWERVNMYLDLDVGQHLFVRNNLFWGGLYEFSFSSTNSLFQNNVFYRTSLFDISSASTYTEGNNAYYTNSGSLRMTSVTDKTITTTFNYLTGLLGYYYLSTNSILIDAGNTNANLVGLYHYTTQTNQVKEANSLVDIGFHYVALDVSGLAADADGDGLPDYVEDVNGNGLLDTGETDWQNSDSDYDGRNDYQEILDGTDPLNPNSVISSRLGFWSFDNTNNWIGGMGQVPLFTTNVLGVLGAISNAVSVDNTNVAVLQYRTVESKGLANINCRQGSLRFYYKPNWTSTSAGGTGPGNAARLIEMGQYLTNLTTGWWSLFVSPDGNHLLFAAGSNGVITTNLAMPIAWLSNAYCQVVLTYTPTNSALYLDMQYATNGSGVSVYPSETDRENGIFVGSDSSGHNQAHGSVDELETFNYPLSPTDVNDVSYAGTPLSGGVGFPVCTAYPSGWIVNYYPKMYLYLCTPEPIAIGEAYVLSGQISYFTGSAYVNYYNSCTGAIVGHSYATLTADITLGWNGLCVTPNEGTTSPDGAGNFTFTTTGVSSGPLALEILADYGLGTLSILPTINTGILPTSRLGYWSFDYNLVGDGGQSPTMNNVSLVASPFGHGVLIDSTSDADLEYPAFQSDGTVGDGLTTFTSSGTPNIRRNSGSVRFWFQPDWTSGSGPASGGVFLDMLAGGLSLQTVSSGTKIELYYINGGTQTTELSRTISWTTGQWHQIVITYSSSKTVLYIDGYEVGADGSGIPNISCTFNGNFRVGSDGASKQVRGIMDELETFNYQLSPADVLANFTATSALLPPAPPGTPSNPSDTTPPSFYLVTPINADPF